MNMEMWYITRDSWDPRRGFLLIGAFFLAPAGRYFMELGASRCMLGASMSSALICIPLVFLLSGWLWKRCGSHYIFIIGLLFCSIRFLGNSDGRVSNPRIPIEIWIFLNFKLNWLGYSLVEEPVFLVAIEMLEPVCSTWMLLTASAHIQRHLAASSRINAFECSLQANSWALIIIFHYCFGNFQFRLAISISIFVSLHIYIFLNSLKRKNLMIELFEGRGVGGFLAAVAAHHFGVTDVFIAAAVITLMSAAVWFTCLHAPTTCCAKRSEQSKKKDGSPSRRGNWNQSNLLGIGSKCLEDWWRDTSDIFSYMNIK